MRIAQSTRTFYPSRLTNAQNSLNTNETW